MALVPLLLAVLAVAEIAVLVLVARWLGLPAAVLLALTTSVLGVLLLRREGIRAWQRFRQAFEAGEPPGLRAADGLVGLVGALLLVLPGFLTDVLGLLLVLPPGRPLARRAVQRIAEARMSSGLAGDVFGPRRVRMRRARTRAETRAETRPADPARPAGPASTVRASTVRADAVPGLPPVAGRGGGEVVEGEVVEGEVVEGEVVDPGDRS
jgi:UPF0716 protein FxsA